MEKKFKVGEEVLVKAKITDHIDDNNPWVKFPNGRYSYVVNSSHIKHAEPEFVPREMMVWDEYERQAEKQFIVGMFKGQYAQEDACGTYVTFKNAKEIPQELENGKVYINSVECISYKIDKQSGFGFTKDFDFIKHDDFSFSRCPEDWQPYSLEDFKLLLIAEAEKRGFKSGVWVDRKGLGVNVPRIEQINNLWESNLCVQQPDNGDFTIMQNLSLIFKNGTWAKIID